MLFYLKKVSMLEGIGALKASYSSKCTYCTCHVPILYLI